MKRDISIWFIVGTIFTILFGSLLHFLYDWSDENQIIGIFSAVNESTWEHLKLLFWPAFFFSLIEYVIIGNKYYNYLTGKAVTFYLGMTLIIVLFYTYTGIVGTHNLFMDIAIFIISIVIGHYVGYKITVSKYEVSKIVNWISIISIMILVFMFVVFTFNPPIDPLFEDPLTGDYGI